MVVVSSERSLCILSLEAIVWLTEYSVLDLFSISLSMLSSTGPILVVLDTSWVFVTVGWFFDSSWWLSQ